MNLTQELAQEIVERTMNVLGKNINIMDCNGIIIGSGNKERINTFHEGAAKVLETGEKLIVTEEEAKALRGVKTGINLPIKFNNRIIGVVGITGNLSEVESYGEIVKNLVELMLFHNFLQKEIELENKAIENFYQQLIGNDINNREQLYDRAKLFNIDNTLYRKVMVIQISPFDNMKINSEIENFNMLFNLDNTRDIFFIRGTSLVFIKSLKKKELKEQSSIIEKIARVILDRFESIFNSVAIGIGQTIQELDKLYLSYEGAKHALKVGEKIYRSEEKIYFIDHLGYDYFIPYLKKNYAEYYLDMFSFDVREVFEDTDTGIILEGMMENDLNISKTAEALFMHRNTLLYRIEKIKGLTGLDPKKAKDLFTLLLAYHLYLYNK